MKINEDELYVLNMQINDLFHSDLFEITEKYGIVGIAFLFENNDDSYVIAAVDKPYTIYIYKSPAEINYLFSALSGNLNLAASLGADYYMISEGVCEEEYLYPENYNEFLKCSKNHPIFNGKNLLMANYSHTEGIKCFNNDDIYFMNNAFIRLKELLNYLKENEYNKNEKIIEVYIDGDKAYVGDNYPLDFDFVSLMNRFKGMKMDISNLKANQEKICIGLMTFPYVLNDKKQQLQLLYAVNSSLKFSYEAYYTDKEHEIENLEKALSKLIIKNGKNSEYMVNNYFILAFLERNFGSNNLVFSFDCLSIFEDHFSTNFYNDETSLKEELDNIFTYIRNFSYPEILEEDELDNQYVS